MPAAAASPASFARAQPSAAREALYVAELAAGERGRAAESFSVCPRK